MEEINVISYLDNAIKYLVSHKKAKISIFVYCDIQGTMVESTKSTQLTAENIIKYLISKGIASNRILAKGMGSSEQIDLNVTSEGRSKNKRIEIKIIQ